ncbi:GNAT family N-acetyltransferase [Rhizobium sp. FKY42]|uniref:acyl-homoserine-lactone synthase n=1 Tax=Rhizobium sp. FKY42 TaxID=2562310 RepID=UPI0010C14A94|nr:GNAT family N-acetyltransferase [Rhizobium sp. FKY42]
MMHIVTSDNLPIYQLKLEQAFRLRHQVFVEEKGWSDLAKSDGREIDQFDNDDAVHMLCEREGEIVGYQRLLPTTKPHLLSTVLRQLCDLDLPCGDNIWEWTRYCVKRSHRERGRKLSPVATELLTAIVEWGMDHEVDQIVIEMEPIWLLRLVQLNFMVTPLGIPRQIEGEDVVAVLAKFDERTLKMLHSIGGGLPLTAAPTVAYSAGEQLHA